MKVLMVCLGNICRSPLAEGILQEKINTLNLKWEVDSAGTSNYHEGDLPDQRSIAIAQKHQIDITYQRSRPFLKSDFERFDSILVMDSSNYQNVLDLAQHETEKQKVELIMNYAKPGYNINVPDPYWDDNGFQKVYDMLEEACDAFIKKHAY